MNDTKVEPYKSVAMRSYDALDVVEFLHLPGVVRGVGISILVKELVHANFANRASVSRTLAFNVIVQTKV
jgi:hypothetical protein